jgi:RHS repeat-associated protein
MRRELRTKSVGTKVSEAELRVLESRAERAGLTLSGWVRDVLLGSSVEQGTMAAERAILAEVLAMRARYYANSMGRFMSPDWSAKVEPVPYAKLDNPQSLNLYAYVGNNPLTDVDVDGHMSNADFSALFMEGLEAQSAAWQEQQAAQTEAVQAALQTVQFAMGMLQMAGLPAQQQSAQSLAAQVPGQVKTAIMNSVNASNAPSGADTTGGFHEEGGIAGTNSSGGLVISPALPGPASHSGVVTESLTPADPNLAGSITDLTVSWHVHPSGRNASGGLAWEQPPSGQDQSVAAGEHQALPGLIHIVVGAGNKQVYFYNGNGSYQQMSLKKFMVGAQ